MNQILSNANASNVSDNIREEIDQTFSQTKTTSGFFSKQWDNEIDVLDAIEESKRIRQNIFNNKPITEGEIPIIKEEGNEKIKKKKKRFIFF